MKMGAGGVDVGCLLHALFAQDRGAKNRQGEEEGNREEKNADRQTDRPTDRQTDREAGRACLLARTWMPLSESSLWSGVWRR